MNHADFLRYQAESVKRLRRKPRNEKAHTNLHHG